MRLSVLCLVVCSLILSARATDSTTSADTTTAVTTTAVTTTAATTTTPATTTDAGATTTTAILTTTATTAAANATTAAANATTQTGNLTTAVATTNATTNATTVPATTTAATNATTQATNASTTAMATTTAATNASTTSFMTNATTTPATTTTPGATFTPGCSVFSPSISILDGGDTLYVAFENVDVRSSTVDIWIGNTVCIGTQPDSAGTGYQCVIPPGNQQFLPVSVRVNTTIIYACPGVFSYAVQALSDVSPARIPQGTTTTITVSGNFGPVSWPASVALMPSTGAPIPLVVDAIKGETRLTMSVPSSVAVGSYSLNVTVNGFNMLRAGFAVLSASTPITVSLAAYADASEFLDSDRLNFCENIASILQDSVPACYITGVNVGSIFVTFLLLTNDNDVAVKMLTTAVENGQFRQLFPSVNTVQVGDTPLAVGTIATPSPSSSDNKLPGYAVALIVIFVVLGVVIGVGMWIKVHRRKRREIPLQIVERRDTNVI